MPFTTCIKYFTYRPLPESLPLNPYPFPSPLCPLIEKRGWGRRSSAGNSHGKLSKKWQSSRVLLLVFTLSWPGPAPDLLHGWYVRSSYMQRAQVTQNL